MLSNLKQLNVIKRDGTYNSRGGMSLSKNPKHQALWESIISMTSFLSNKSTTAQRIHVIVNNITHKITCVTCEDNETKFISFNQGYQQFCSAKCAQNNKNTRYKRKTTLVSRYGSEYPCGNTEINNKRKATCNERYGTDTPFDNIEIQAKVRTTILDKYGVSSTSLIPAVQQKQKETRMCNLGHEYPFQSPHIQQLVTDSHLKKYGHSRYSKSTIPTQTIENIEDKQWMREQHFITSVGEKEVLHFIKSCLPNTTILSNDRNIIHPKELDIYLPEYKLAIEYCGLYWHSDKFKNRNYHSDKLKACNAKGIRLLTIFEDEWNDENIKGIIKSKISNIIHISSIPSVYARKTKIIELSNVEKGKFFNKYHIQGSGPGSVSYGLQHNGDIVAAITFIKQQDNAYVLNRYATSCPVPGGFTKLLTHFQRIHDWTDIISFADLRYSNGQLYESTGWTLDKILPPDYYWCKNSKRFHKFGFRRKHLANKLSVYDDTLSENENCKIDGYLKLFNCGMNRYIIHNS